MIYNVIVIANIRISSFLIQEVYDFDTLRGGINKYATYFFQSYDNPEFYSVLRLFTGFAIAALNVLMHSIIKAIKNIMSPPAKNTHQLNVVL